MNSKFFLFFKDHVSHFLKDSLSHFYIYRVLIFLSKIQDLKEHESLKKSHTESYFLKF